QRLRIIRAKKRRGFAFAVKHLLLHTAADVVVVLNDDIIIKNDNFLDQLTEPFRRQKGVGLVGGRVEPLPSRSFWQEIARLNFAAVRRSFASGKNPQHPLTCNGKVMALSRKFINSLKFPRDLSMMGNVDNYLYFSCLESRFTYVSNQDAVVYFKFADTPHEFTNWTLRNVSTMDLLAKSFGKKVYTAFQLPKRYFFCFTGRELLTHIPHVLVLFVFHFYVQWKKRSITTDFNPTWDVIKSTKNI
ncbi:MAG: glycosyltransferase, partial [Patescibacteria group bacterium]